MVSRQQQHAASWVDALDTSASIGNSTSRCEIRKLATAELVRRQSADTPDLAERESIDDPHEAVRIVSQLHDAVSAFQLLIALATESEKDLAQIKQKLRDSVSDVVVKLQGLKTDTLDQKQIIKTYLNSMRKPLGFKYYWREETCTLGARKVPRSRSGAWQLGATKGGSLAATVSFPKVTVRPR